MGLKKITILNIDIWSNIKVFFKLKMYNTICIKTIHI